MIDVAHPTTEIGEELQGRFGDAIIAEQATCDGIATLWIRAERAPEIMRHLKQQVRLRFAHANTQRQHSSDVAHAQHVHPRLVVSVLSCASQAANDFEPRLGQLSSTQAHFLLE